MKAILLLTSAMVFIPAAGQAEGVCPKEGQVPISTSAYECRTTTEQTPRLRISILAINCMRPGEMAAAHTPLKADTIAGLSYWREEQGDSSAKVVRLAGDAKIFGFNEYQHELISVSENEKIELHLDQNVKLGFFKVDDKSYFLSCDVATTVAP